MAGEVKYSAIHLERDSGKPLFRQLEEELRRLIDSMPLNSREKLISERKLAALLGIDRSTVSKAYGELERSGLLVRSSIRSLRVSPSGRRRRLEPFPNVGIILPDDFSRFIEEDERIPLEYFKGILDCAAENRISTLMMQLPDANAPAAGISAFVNDLGRRLIGIIHLGDRLMYPDSVLHRIMRCAELPQVIISADTDYRNIMQVLPDIRTGAEKLAAKMREYGLKDVGIICRTSEFGEVPVLPYFCYSSMKRCAAFRTFFMESGFRCDDSFHMFSCVDYPAVLKNLLLKLESGDLPEVYWCYNDVCAVWLLRACREAGLRVPEDVSVVGFDGIDIPEAADLATVKMPFREIGRRAFELILECYGDGVVPEHEKVMSATDFVNGGTLGRNRRMKS